jgi:hypothetical protein
MATDPATPVAVPAPEAPPIQVKLAATPQERERIYRFRYSVYVDEMGKKTDSYADHARRMLFDKLDESAILLYATSGDQLVGTIRANCLANSAVSDETRRIHQLHRFARFAPESIWFTSRLMILKAERGSMALTVLLSRAYEIALEHQVVFDFCNCAPSLVELYEKLGYRRYIENFVDPEVGYRVPLVAMPRDAEHLRAIRSPFWRKLKGSPQLWLANDVRQWFADEFKCPAEQEWTVDEDEFFRFLADKYHLSRSDSVPLLEGLSEGEAGEVLHGAVLHAKAGDPVIRAGDVGKEMFVVISGAVEVCGTDGRVLAALGPGQVFGEIAGLLQTKRTADVRAVADSEVLVLNHDKVARLMKLSPAIAARVLFNLSRILAERLVVTTRAVCGGGQRG